MSPGETVAFVALAWTVLGCALALLIARAIPASPEPDEHEACHGDPEALRAVRQSGVINDFHQGFTLANREQDHG